MDNIYSHLDELAETLEGELKHDIITTTIYSTDASVYKEEPVAVAWPKGVSDIRNITGRTGSEFRYYYRYLKVHEQDT
jgi:hypothetical protein